MKKNLPLIAIVLLLISCNNKTKADLLIYNATIYTVDSQFSKAEAMVIKDGKILATGKLSDLEKNYAASEKMDANGKFIYPGFIDAHAHFLSYGLGLQKVNLVETNSWEEVLERTKVFAKENNQAGSWLLGRGWDQNDWTDKTYPDNSQLNLLFPDRPVMLGRVDGHAVIVNQAALDLAGIKPGQKLEGGDIEMKNGKLTGILVDNAVDIVSRLIPPTTAEGIEEALKDAEKNCLAAGLTTIDDCGLNFSDVEAIRSAQQVGKLKMRLYVMLSDNKRNFDWLIKNGTVKTDRLNVRSIKVYADGALGSRGACLLQPYADKPGWSGFLLSSISHFDSVAKMIDEKGWQMCTHAIGDSGNRTMLNIYAKYLKGKNDKRWRIEHAQVVNENDFSMFGRYSIIPSVQPTHATSDMNWAAERLGSGRVKGAYAYQQLLKENEWIPLGTDFPVEDISPIRTFFAAVIRKDNKGWPENGYQPENALTREQAIRGMTVWAARANFEENEKGSLEKGKLADFIILDKDLMNTLEKDILSTKVLGTFIAGEKLYSK